MNINDYDNSPQQQSISEIARDVCSKLKLDNDVYADAKAIYQKSNNLVRDDATRFSAALYLASKEHGTPVRCNKIAELFQADSDSVYRAYRTIAKKEGANITPIHPRRYAEHLKERLDVDNQHIEQAADITTDLWFDHEFTGKSPTITLCAILLSIEDVNITEQSLRQEVRASKYSVRDRKQHISDLVEDGELALS